MIEPDRLESLLSGLGDLLQSRGLSYSIATIGGASLALLRLGVRPTRDLDVVALVDQGLYSKADPLPAPLLEAARDIAAAFGIEEDWLNAVASSVMDHGLPEGFAERTEVRHFGTLTVHAASRFDQICLKLHAAVDRAPASKHLDDLRLLGPTPDELLAAGKWSITHDPSQGYRSQLILLLEMLGVPDARERL